MSSAVTSRRSTTSRLTAPSEAANVSRPASPTDAPIAARSRSSIEHEDAEAASRPQCPREVGHEGLIAGQDRAHQRTPGQRDRDSSARPANGGRDRGRVRGEEEGIRQAATALGSGGARRRLAKAGGVGVHADAERRRRAARRVEDRGTITRAEVDRSVAGAPRRVVRVSRRRCRGVGVRSPVAWRDGIARSVRPPGGSRGRPCTCHGSSWLPLRWYGCAQAGSSRCSCCSRRGAG